MKRVLRFAENRSDEFPLTRVLGKELAGELAPPPPPGSCPGIPRLHRIGTSEKAPAHSRRSRRNEGGEWQCRCRLKSKETPRPGCSRGGQRETPPPPPCSPARRPANTPEKRSRPDLLPRTRSGPRSGRRRTRWVNRAERPGHGASCLGPEGATASRRCRCDRHRCGPRPSRPGSKIGQPHRTLPRPGGGVGGQHHHLEASAHHQMRVDHRVGFLRPGGGPEDQQGHRKGSSGHRSDHAVCKLRKCDWHTFSLNPKIASPGPRISKGAPGPGGSESNPVYPARSSSSIFQETGRPRLSKEKRSPRFPVVKTNPSNPSSRAKSSSCSRSGSRRFRSTPAPR